MFRSAPGTGRVGMLGSALAVATVVIATHGGCDHADGGGDDSDANPGDAKTDSLGDGSRDTGSGTAPFATIVRIVNDGASDYRLNYHPSFACPVGLAITGPDAPIDQPTSIEASDTLCPCATCQPGASRSPICTTVDLVCDVLAPIVIPRGGAYDFNWDGTVTVWRSDVPACSQMCSETFAVPAGPGYRFTLTPFSALASGPQWQTDVPLPAPEGIVVIHVQ